MFNAHHFYIFILLFLFGILLVFFNSYTDHYRFLDVITWILIAVPVMGFVYLSKFRNADVNPFYFFFSTLLVFYLLVFAGTKLYAFFSPEIAQGV